jgi:hypothetical protein
MARRRKKFNPKVSTLPQVTDRLKTIDTHLKALNKFLNKFSWGSPVKRKRKPPPGGELGGGKPPGWPP